MMLLSHTKIINTHKQLIKHCSSFKHAYRASIIIKLDWLCCLKKRVFNKQFTMIMLEEKGGNSFNKWYFTQTITTLVIKIYKTQEYMCMLLDGRVERSHYILTTMTHCSLKGYLITALKSSKSLSSFSLCIAILVDGGSLKQKLKSLIFARKWRPYNSSWKLGSKQYKHFCHTQYCDFHHTQIEDLFTFE